MPGSAECLPQHHLKHVSNALLYDITTSQHDYNVIFQLHCNVTGPPSSMQSIIDQHLIIPCVSVCTTVIAVTSEAGHGIKGIRWAFNVTCNVQFLEFTMKMCLCIAGPRMMSFHSVWFHYNVSWEREKIQFPAQATVCVEYAYSPMSAWALSLGTRVSTPFPKAAHVRWAGVSTLSQSECGCGWPSDGRAPCPGLGPTLCPEL